MARRLMARAAKGHTSSLVCQGRWLPSYQAQLLVLRRGCSVSFAASCPRSPLVLTLLSTPVYPIDLVKTNVQQRALSGHGAQMTGWQLFNSLLRERPPPNPRTRDTAARRFLRLYRGLGVSALRSFISHGLTWMIIETVSERISQRRPLSASDDESSTL